MGNEQLFIEKMCALDEEEWDGFIVNSVNGTFLQSRKFLNYHPKERFTDASLIVRDNNSKIVALIPACEMEENGRKILWSHKGSTYGGIVTDRKHWRAEALEQIILCVDEYFKHHYQEVFLKITPSVIGSVSDDLLDYLLFLHGYDRYVELDTYLDFAEYKSDIVMNFNETKRKHIRRLQKYELVFRELKREEEIAEFHKLLTLNLHKFGLKPVHSLPELLELKKDRLPENIDFYGVEYRGEILAAGMVFDFGNGVVHTQNLSSDPGRKDINAIEYLYYGVIRHYKDNGTRYLSWGISTEEQGRILNHGLIRNKESYGSKYYLNKTFYKRYDL